MASANAAPGRDVQVARGQQPSGLLLLTSEVQGLEQVLGAEHSRGGRRQGGGAARSVSHRYAPCQAERGECSGHFSSAPVRFPMATKQPVNQLVPVGPKSAKAREVCAHPEAATCWQLDSVCTRLAVGKLTVSAAAMTQVSVLVHTVTGLRERRCHWRGPAVVSSGRGRGEESALHAGPAGAERDPSPQAAPQAREPRRGVAAPMLPPLPLFPACAMALVLATGGDDSVPSQTPSQQRPALRAQARLLPPSPAQASLQRNE
eukprot:1099242-Rhodomonas_salina.2